MGERKKKKILVVDDSQVTRNFHAYILRSAGYEVIDAIDGADALEKLYMHPEIACVITDLNMPKMDGLTLIGRIREDDAFKDLPIIIVTTLNDSTDKLKGYEVGANFYIVKPADPKFLVKSIQIALGEMIQ